MYPQRELNRLNAYKIALLRDIATNRTQCVNAARRASQPLVWIDRLMVLWQKLTPLTLFAAVPLGFILKRAVLPKFKILGLIVRWAPFAFAALQGVRVLGKRASASRARAMKQPGQTQAT